MGGHLILVVGPSGAGKDSLIDSARSHFAGNPNLVFPHRVITRPAKVAAEDHDTLSSEAFAEAEKRGAFFLHWQAHGLSYGLPIAIEDALRGGKVVVANVSRSVLAQALLVWPQTTAIFVTAAPETLAARVAARARPEDGDVQKRISRKADLMPANMPCVTILNDGTIAAAIATFCAALARIRNEAINCQ